ncbi:class I SAM-dependent methyltransferase [Ornithinimicrobium faecis]|uniref:Class I SAM-dependent methyltransferase n=1 Tax=Ornithinimicrobium faecis TaxID=2934158 RepID=A0ABY4YSX5_9MICO|nr:class I SAM-dependent methyltransferase [Ornithinimicrobium sp. HY1793]USQ79823.1 class I SAM-dependent methyltransferase [Ornithinimicrobium sp. HY1793]
MGTDDVQQGWKQGGQGWVANERILDAAFAPLTQALVERVAWARGDRVLDVGCGTGTLLELGVRDGVEMVGVDVSAAMVEAARRRVPEATVLEADAGTADLLEAAPGLPFDHVVSRYGVMFFSDPTTAFDTIRRATRPGATMTFGCWRSREENPVFTQGLDLLEAALPEPVPHPAPGAPGPTAFADAERLRGVLNAAGWAEIVIEPFDYACRYGLDGSDGVEERLAILASNGRGVWGRLQDHVGPERQAELLDKVRADLRSRRVDGVVSLPAAAWLVTARNLGVEASD